MNVFSKGNSKLTFYLSSERKKKQDMELLEEILAKDNMNKAYKKVCENKGVAGVDGITVDEVRRVFERKWKKNSRQNKKKRIQTATSEESTNTKRKWQDEKFRDTNSSRQNNTTSNGTSASTNIRGAV